MLGCARPKEEVPFGELVARAGRVELPAAERAKYEGTYDIVRPDGRAMTITVRSEPQGMIADTPSGKMPLAYRGDDAFGTDFDPSMRLTILFDAGKPTGARLTQGGATWEGKRRP
jgi:hypothetical protein